MDPGTLLTSRTNPRVKQLRAAFAGQARLSSGLVAIEGDHLVTEALRSGLLLKTVFLSERREAPAWLPTGVEVLRLSAEVFGSAAETRSPQGIAALLLPPVRALNDVVKAGALLLIVVGLQDPGNLGTLVRSAEAFGASGLLTTPGTVSPWNQKAVRASAGSIFRMPVASASLDDVATLPARGFCLLAAVPPSPGAVDLPGMSFEGSCGLMLGNEGAGLPAEWSALAAGRVTIPCPGPVESLNVAVAGSLLLYAASQQRGLR